MGGMKIKTHYTLPENEHLSIKVVLGDNVIWSKGKVVYSKSAPDKQAVSGIQFIELSPQDSALLQGYLSTLGRSPKQGVSFPQGGKERTEKSKRIY